jgi:hypothetical protein
MKKTEVKEIDWKPKTRKVLPKEPELLISIGLEKQVCPVCNGTGRELVECQETSSKTRQLRDVQCPCLFLKMFWKKFHDTVPVRDRHASLRTLKYSSLSKLPEKTQLEEIASLKVNPDKSRLFIGPSGTGKTTFSVALYRDALEKACKHCLVKDIAVNSVWRITTKQLMEEFRDDAAHRVTVNDRGETVPPKKPTVTAHKIKMARDAGLTPRLFLEEVDKIQMNEFRFNSLYEVVNGIYENNGQIVINSNLTLIQLTKFFGDMSMVLIRRMLAGGKVHNYFDLVKSK